MALKAIVQDGRLKLDEETDLPDGTVVELVADDESIDMTAEELRHLNARINKSAESIAEGRGVDGETVLQRLRSKTA